MDEIKKPMVPLSFRRPAAPQPDARSAVADLCTLAPWDELAAFRKEVMIKFEEAFEVAQERREGETRLGRMCQQLETKVERFARQVRGLHSRSEVFEGHMTSQAKELDSCRELHDALRDKIQQGNQELSDHFSSSLGTLRAEVEDALERRHGAALEASRRADRTMADELLRKMGELNEKLGANMLSLEEEVAEDSKQLRSEIKSQNAKLSDGISALEAQVEQTATRHEARLGKVQEGAHEAARDIAATAERGQAEHANRLAALEVRIGKLNDVAARLEVRIAAEEQASVQKAEHLQELLDEGSAQTAASLVRVRTEADTTTRDIVRALRDELRDDLRGAREEAKVLRDELRVSTANSREQAALMQKESFGKLSELKDELHTMCRDVVGMVDSVRVQVANVQTESRSDDEALREKMHDELDARLIEIREQVNAVREEAREACQGATDRITALSEVVNGTQQRLSDVSTSVVRLQSATDDLTTDSTRIRTYVDAGINELRREFRAEVMHTSDRHDSSVKSQFSDVREELQLQLASMRTEANERLAGTEKEFDELVQRFSLTQRAAEDNKVQLLEEFRERTIELKQQHTEDAARAEEQCQGVARQVEMSVAGLRNELMKVVTMARESNHDVERACRRLVEESHQAHETSFTEAFRAHKEACNGAISESLVEPRLELKNLRALLADQAGESAARTEQLANDVQRQAKTRGEDFKRELDDLGGKLEEQLNTFASNTRAGLQEQRQELRQHVARQLDERLRSLSDRISEATGECKVMRRTEEDLGHRCERLQKTCAELSSTQDVLAQQSSATAQELLELRAEIRAELRQEHRVADRGAHREQAHRERHYERPLLRSEQQIFSDLPGTDAPSFSIRHEVKEDSPPKFRSQSLDRWGWTGHLRDTQRPRPRTTFDSVIGASPVARGGSTSPPPSPRQLRSSEERWRSSEDRWSLSARTARDYPRLSDPLGSPPRGLLARPRASLGSSPPRSPLSLHTRAGQLG